MKLAIHHPDFGRVGTPPDTIAPALGAAAKAAEDGGCAAFTVMDHFFQLDGLGGGDHPMLEGYTTLGYVAAVTERIPVGLLVGGVTYRNPGLVAQTTTTLDVLSEGRAIFGIGAAWYEREHKAHGVRFPPIAERFELLEETLQIALQMWSDDNGPYEGKHFQLAETYCEPPPVQRPHPPIMIGGGGEKKTLRLVAKYADITNLITTKPDEVAHKLDVLRGHCDTEDRDYDTIRKTVLGGDPFRDPDGFLRTMEELGKLGIEQVWVMPTGGPGAAGQITEVCEKVLPRLEQL